MDEEELEEYIKNIKGIIEGNYTSIYIEEALPLESKKMISTNLSLEYFSGREIRLYNLPFIFEEITLELGRKIIEEEVLIISNDSGEITRMIYSISDMFRFVSVLGLDKEFGEAVYEEILDNTGISVYFPQCKDISFKRYGIIINSMDDVLTPIKEIKNNSIIFDFSENKPFKDANRYVIEDISIDAYILGLADNPWINKEINSNLYHCLFKKGHNKFCRIIKNDTSFTIRDFVNQGLKIKGGY